MRPCDLRGIPSWSLKQQTIFKQTHSEKNATTNEKLNQNKTVLILLIFILKTSMYVRILYLNFIHHTPFFFFIKFISTLYMIIFHSLSLPGNFPELVSSRNGSKGRHPGLLVPFPNRKTIQKKSAEFRM